MNDVPLWRAAASMDLSQVRLGRRSPCARQRSPRRPARTAIGWMGCSMVPSGLDFVFLPNSEVGEYCPLVRP